MIVLPSRYSSSLRCTGKRIFQGVSHGARETVKRDRLPVEVSAPYLTGKNKQKNRNLMHFFAQEREKIPTQFRRQRRDADRACGGNRLAVCFHEIDAIRANTQMLLEFSFDPRIEAI